MNWQRVFLISGGLAAGNLLGYFLFRNDLSFIVILIPTSLLMGLSAIKVYRTVKEKELFCSKCGNILVKVGKYKEIYYCKRCRKFYDPKLRLYKR